MWSETNVAPSMLGLVAIVSVSTGTNLNKGPRPLTAIDESGCTLVCEGCGLSWDNSKGLTGSVHEGVASASKCYELCAAYEGFQYGAATKHTSGKCICAASYKNHGKNANWNIYSGCTVNWCKEFQQRVSATVACENGKDKVFLKNQLEEAKTYCEGKTECLGVARHPNGKYTPRCGNMVTEIDSVSWLNKNDCFGKEETTTTTVTETTPTPNTATMAGGCTNTNGGMRDKWRKTCDWYVGREEYCGKQDYGDFKAKEMCCACKGCINFRSDNYCENRKSLGHCTDAVYTGYMRRNCKKSCGACGSCHDLIQNQDETGVDCGGVCNTCDLYTNTIGKGCDPWVRTNWSNKDEAQRKCSLNSECSMVIKACDGDFYSCSSTATIRDASSCTTLYTVISETCELKDTSLSGGIISLKTGKPKAFRSFPEALEKCKKEYACKGLTFEPGTREWSLRSDTPEASNSGEISILMSCLSVG